MSSFSFENMYYKVTSMNEKANLPKSLFSSEFLFQRANSKKNQMKKPSKTTKREEFSIGNIFEEAITLGLAKAFQDATDYNIQHPKLEENFQNPLQIER